jgi:hypothetical protein
MASYILVAMGKSDVVISNHYPLPLINSVYFPLDPGTRPLFPVENIGV